jgi:serine/threonine protein kinase
MQPTLIPSNSPSTSPVFGLRNLAQRTLNFAFSSDDEKSPITQRLPRTDKRFRLDLVDSPRHAAAGSSNPNSIFDSPLPDLAGSRTNGAPGTTRPRHASVPPMSNWNPFAGGTSPPALVLNDSNVSPTGAAAPCSPTGLSGALRKSLSFARDSLADLSGPDQPAGRQELSSRFEMEFEVLGKLGGGTFGTVWRVRKRLDGISYAVKAINRPIRGASGRERVLKEVYALAAVCNKAENPHVVRYFNSWLDGDRLFIQTELCDSSLEDVLAKGGLSEVRWAGAQQGADHARAAARGGGHAAPVADGAAGTAQGQLGALGHQAREHLHQAGRVQTGGPGPRGHGPGAGPRPKPARAPAAGPANERRPDLYDAPAAARRLARRGGRGRGACARACVCVCVGARGAELTKAPPEMQGDSRYMPRELLQERHEHLPKADVFSLGISAYQVFLRGALPPNGDAWGALRDGQFCPQAVSRMGQFVFQLLQLMMHPDPVRRPSAEALLATGGPGGVLSTQADRTRSQLEREVEVLRDYAQHSLGMFAAVPHVLRRANTM